VNRKKQKRRQKAALKAAAEQAVNGHDGAASGASNPLGPDSRDYEGINSEDDDDGYEYDVGSPRRSNGAPMLDPKSKKGKKKKKKKNSPASDVAEVSSPPMEATLSTQRGSGMSRDKIWSTSNQEERERIKEFWLGLGEDERKSLVKVEKDAVLKKMKEQQKHTCSCTVCGRKRTAIEEELEGLYDAYYLELEQFANQGEGPPMLAPHRDFSAHHFRGSHAHTHAPYPPQPPSRGRIVEHVGDEEDEDELDEVYSEDDVDDEYSDDEPPEEYHHHHHHHHSPHDRDMADFLTFGNSLQVKGTQLLESLLRRYGNMDLGGILTVADDLLKNDGKRFIEMMEQLAERRMAREEDARDHFTRSYGHPNGSYSSPHNHPPLEDDDYEEEDDEEDDYDDSQDEEYEDEEVYSSPSVMPSRPYTECCCQDPMTEEQRMEEGRRMFQIFAARMFEQRVLSAYKEKVAKERQAKLIEELEEENRKEDEQKAKKAKNAQKKKEKAAQKKQAQAEEKARKEAEKAAEEAAKIESEQRRAAEQRMRAEEKKKQKEAQRKAEEEARLKKEADRQRRIHEQKEKQAEQERKARESKEREKKLKEDQRLKEKGIREQRERESLERKEKQERDKQEKEARAAKSLREAQEAKEAREKLRDEKAKEEKVSQRTAPPLQQPSPSLAKRTLQAPINVPTVLPQHPSNPANFASPKVPVATPVVPKAPTPMRARTLSQQHHDNGQQSSSASQSGSTPMQEPSPHLGTSIPSVSSPGNLSQQRKESIGSSAFPLQPTHSTSPQTGPTNRPSQSTPIQLPHMSMQPPPGLVPHHPPPGFSARVGPEPMLPPGFRPAPNMMMPPPGIGSPVGRGFSPVPMPPPGFAQGPVDQFHLGQGFPLPKDGPPPPPHPTHIRHGSAGYDSAPGGPTQPIGRPAPIGRPGSNITGNARDDKEDEAQHLGSRVLVEDDEPLSAEVNLSGSLRTQAPGPRPGFPPTTFAESGFNLAHNPWGPSNGAHAFGHPGLSNPTWGVPNLSPPFNMATPVPNLGAMRPGPFNHLTLRVILCQAIKDLVHAGQADGEGFLDFQAVKVHLDSTHGELGEQEVKDVLDTEGNASNGGGTFDSKLIRGHHLVRWLPDSGEAPQPRSIGALGQIGSPVARPTTLQGI
jgi:hypothetical protein